MLDFSAKNRVTPSGPALSLLAALAGCSSSQSAPAEQQPQEESTGDEGAADTTAAPAQPMLQGWQLELQSFEAQVADGEAGLESAFRAANCDSAIEHRDVICELSERICEIAEEHPEAAARCDDADSRCARARERFADECG